MADDALFPDDAGTDAAAFAFVDLEMTEQHEHPHEDEDDEENPRKSLWVEQTDAATGDVYYINSKTKEVRFDGDDGAEEESAEKQRRKEARQRDRKVRSKARMARKKGRPSSQKERRFDPNDRMRKPPSPGTLFKQAQEAEVMMSDRERKQLAAMRTMEAMSRGMRSSRSLDDLGKSGVLVTLNDSLKIKLPTVTASLEKLSMVEQYNVSATAATPQQDESSHTRAPSRPRVFLRRVAWQSLRW